MAPKPSNMSDQQVRQIANDQDAALARQLLSHAKVAALAVIDAEGSPFVALTAPAIASNGAPLVLVSSLSTHGKVLAAAGRVSMLFSGVEDPTQPMKTPRLTIQGLAVEAPLSERSSYLSAQPNADLYIDFGDMQLYTIEVEIAHLVVGFGRAVSLSAEQLINKC